MSREDFAALNELYRMLNRGVPVSAKIKAFHAKASRISAGKADKGKKGTFSRGACFAMGCVAPMTVRA